MENIEAAMKRIHPHSNEGELRIIQKPSRLYLGRC